MRAVWESIKTDPWFWERLSKYPDTYESLAYLAQRVTLGDDVYFITGRPGIAAKTQTERWLEKHWPTVGVPKLTVLISAHKGLCARALGSTSTSTTGTRTWWTWSRTIPPPRTFLLDRPWNRGLKWDRRVANVVGIAEAGWPIASQRDQSRIA